MRARYGLTPRWVASSRLAAHERREGLAQHTPPVGAISECGSDEGRRRLRFSAGATATQVATLNCSGGRDGPRRFDGDARNSARTDGRATPATLRLHLDVSIPGRAQDRYVAKNAFASVTEATDNVAWPLLKNRVLTSSVNTWPPLAGCLLTEQRLSI